MPNVLPAAIGFRIVPGNFAPMKGADFHGQAQEDGCGHTLCVWLKVEDGRVTASSYVTDGCDSFVLGGSLVAFMAQGLTLEEAEALQPEPVLAALGSDDVSSRHCVDLALRALRAAVASRPKV